jgi:hypothetical protein
MDPFLIYALLFLGAVGIGIYALVVAPAVKRRCPECGSRVPIGKRVCRNCQYRFA